MTPLLGWAFAGLAFLLILAFDVFITGRRQKSMSRVMVEAAAKRPIVAALFGLIVGALIGHFFWPLDSCLEALRKGAL